MKINITKAQYRDLIIMSALANGVLGILGDMVTSEERDYKKLSNKTSEIEEYLLQHAHEFECGDLVQHYEDKLVLDDGVYENEFLPILYEYDEYTLCESLANKLAWRDFRRDHTEEEIEKMAEENGGYFGVELYDYEKKYWDEFEQNGYERLEVGQQKPSA